MKLYYSAGACSLAPHILLHEVGAPFKLEAVNLKTKEYSGGDFTKVNPKGAVPTLETDQKEILTENAVILQYISDLKPEKKLLAKIGSFERYRGLEWLNYIATEMHKGFSPLWNPKTPDQYKSMVKEMLGQKFDYLTGKLGRNQYLMGENFTAPDAYLFTILSWSKFLNVELSKWPALTAYLEGVKARPATTAALNAEKLKQ